MDIHWSPLAGKLSSGAWLLDHSSASWFKFRLLRGWHHLLI